MIGGVPSQLRREAWIQELCHEPCGYLKNFILDGITSGFKIVDDVPIPSYYCENYSSISNDGAKTMLGELYQQELAEGKFVVSSDVPDCVHAIGAIGKPSTFRDVI